MIRKQGYPAQTNRSSGASVREDAAKNSAFEHKEFSKKQLIDICALFEAD